ncbi:MAG TPA: ATP-binding protein [Anaerolineales bacterium]|nr:ATP-binding protein [Anaerolineales bacterium]
MSIRFKVILPYLLLTLFVAATGAYVVTRLVSDSLQERLRNQLIEAGRVVSDALVGQEQDHVDVLRLVAYTRGIGEALQAGNQEQVSILALPVASGTSAESVILFDAQGQESSHFIRKSDGEMENSAQPGRPPTLSIVNEILQENNPDSPPKREIAIDPADGRYYYFTTLPVVFDGKVVGAVVVGTSLNTIMPALKSTSLADVILYDESGHSIASTFAWQDDLYQPTISIPVADYQSIINSDHVVEGKNIPVGKRFYSLASGPLRVGNDRLAVFSVALSSDFVAESGTMSRRNYVLIYAVAMIAVILIGYFVSRLIIVPLLKLVRTSRAIASGDLTKRTGIKSRDEIGILANSFDSMTESLQQRTLELEKANQVLEQMDAAKMRFIQVAAHELRTPLTLVQGYSQMIQVKSKENNEYTKYTSGILDGTSRMVEIIDNMLDVTRIDSNLLEIIPTDVDLKQVIEKVRTTFESALTERKLTFATQGLDSVPVIVGDKDLLYKLFYHVIVNAIKYTPDGGCITVSENIAQANSRRHEVEIDIHDTGIGVDPQNHALVFEKFYQTGEVLLHSSGKTKFKGGGPGLGLAIARGIVNAHRGRIWLESPGFNESTLPGTTVFIRLPINGQSHERS